jgi:hypothetical protein
MNTNTREGIAILETILISEDINDVQEIVFRQCWQGKTYPEIAESFGYDVDYIKNVGSKLWKLLSKQLGEKVSKSNFRSVLRRIAQQNQVESVLKSGELHGNGFRMEFLTVSGQKAVNYLDQFQELTGDGEGRTVFQSFDSFKNTQSTKCSLEERLNALPQLKAKIETLLVMVENAMNNAQKADELK